MYLTRLLLDPLDARTAAVLADAYRLHQAVLSGFQGGREACGVLYRVEPERPHQRVPVLVQSQVEPAWEGALDRWLAAATEVRTVDLAFTAGQVLRFRLRGNPTRRLPAGGALRPDGTPRDGQRVDLRREAEQLAWLDRKAAAAGFAVLDAAASDRGAVTGRRGDRTLTHRLVDFDGHLRIVDPRAFEQAWRAGLGPAKAFGCGLLSLAPA